MIIELTATTRVQGRGRASQADTGVRSSMAAPVCHIANARMANDGGLMFDTGSMSTPTMLRGYHNSPVKVTRLVRTIRTPSQRPTMVHHARRPAATSDPSA